MGKPEVLALEEVRELATLRWQEVMEYSPEAMARRVRNLCATVERHVVEASGLAAGMPLLRGSLGDAESERDRLRGLVAGMREEIERLLELAHNRDGDVFDRSIDLRIARIRKKIEQDATKPQVLKTVRGAGYMFSSGRKR